MTTAVVVAWAALVAAATVLVRPERTRLRALVAPAEPAPRRDPARTVGLTALRLARRGDSNVDPERLGRALLAAAALLAVSPLASVLAGTAVWALPAARARRAARAHLDAVADDVPDVVDLLLLAVGAGCNLVLAVEAVARRGAGPLSRELALVVDEVHRGRRLGDALDDLPVRSGEAVRPLVACLAAGERYGVPLETSLARVAADVRDDHRRRSEAAARKVPVKLLFPLLGCILPAFGLLTLAPLLAGGLTSLRL